MAQYIDKAAIVAEIKRRISNHNKELQHASDEDFVSSWASDEESQKLALTALIPFLNTLEVKEVDLEKEVRNFLNDNYTSVEEPDEFLTTTMQIDDMTKFAEHFFILGLNGNNSISPTTKDLIQMYVSDHGEYRWLDASELEQLLNDFVLEYDIIQNREYEQQCKCKSK